jgi:DNA-binding transcriptional MocR family regulator
MRKSNSSSALAQLLRAELGRRDPGERLPSVRALMRRHRVSPVTVRQAVAQLTSEGLIEARPGHGTFVAHRSAPPGEADLSWQTLALGSGRVSADAVAALLVLPGAGAINLAGGYPAPDLQAISLVTAAMARAVRRPGVWGRMPLEGIEPLRAWFAAQIGEQVAPRDVLVSPGSQAAITACFTALGQPGAAVLIESPTYVGAIVAARAAGLRVVPIPTDRDGVSPERLVQAFAASGARLFYGQPTHANPSGASLAEERRQAVLDVVESAGAFLIEDDWCRDLSFEVRPPRPLVTQDRHGHVIYLRSLTKSAAPGLRIGAICARGPALARLTAARVITDFFVPGPSQEAAIELITTPAWQRHLRAIRTVLLERRDVLVSGVREAFGPDSLPIVPSGGTHLWVKLADGTDDAELARRAAAVSVVVSPGRHWFPAEPPGPHLRLSYGCADGPALRRATALLGELMEPRRRRPVGAARRRAVATDRV